MKNNINYSEFFQDGDGMFSMTRLCLFLVVASVLVVWVSTSCLKSSIQEIPEGVRWMLGFLCGAKVTQSFAENKSP